MGHVVRRQEKEEEEEEEEWFESGRSSATQCKTSYVSKGIPPGLDGRSVSRHPSGSRRQRPDLSDIGMGRYTDKRHVLRSRSSESRSHRRRLVSHRLHGETKERQSARALERLAVQIRQLDQQEGFDFPLQVKKSWARYA